MATLVGKRIFHAPPVNVDLFGDHGRQIYYRSNLEHVAGILATSNGGTGNTEFKEGELIIYSSGKLISSGVKTADLSEMGSKVSGISTYDGTALTIDEKTKVVKLPDYLLKTGGTVSGDLVVQKSLTVGNVNIHFDNTSQCVAFTMVG